MKAPTAAEWRAILMRLHRAKSHPFDGRKADMLLGVAVFLSTRARGSRVVLRDARELYGERIVRRYVSVLTHADLLELVVKPNRPKPGGTARMAVYEFRDPTQPLPSSSTETGSGSCVQKGQRSCSAAVGALEAWQARPVPTSTHKPSCLPTKRAELLPLLLPRVASLA